MSKKILYIQFTNPAAYPPLQHGSRILADQGWQVKFIGTGAFGAGELEFPEHKNITVKLIPYRKPGFSQKLSYLFFCLYCLVTIFVWKPKFVYASDALSCPAAYLVWLVTRTKIIYHEHDFPATQSGSKMNYFENLIFYCRAQVSKKASVIILPNKERADIFKKEHRLQIEPIVVWNCPSIKEVCPNVSQDSGLFRILYHGSIVPIRMPLAVLYAIAMLPENVVLRIIGYETIGNIGYLGKIKSKAAELGIEKKIEILGPVHRHRLLNLGAECNVGVAFMPKDTSDINEKYMVGASNKPFDYLASGVALLVTDLPEWNELYVQNGYGLACDPEDYKSLADKIKYFLDNPERARKMGAMGQEMIIKEWNYEKQYKLFTNQLNTYENF